MRASLLEGKNEATLSAVQTKASASCSTSATAILGAAVEAAPVATERVSAMRQLAQIPDHGHSWIVSREWVSFRRRWRMS